MVLDSTHMSEDEVLKRIEQLVEQRPQKGSQRKMMDKN